MDNIKELIFIDLDKESELCNRDCFVSIAKKIQKSLIMSNLKNRDLESSISGYREYSEKYFKLVRELKKLPNDIESYHLVKMIISLLD
tara:strand:- start:37 stop:300 length:264 start_codon:yes stop_codon:yes gene_type:complete